MERESVSTIELLTDQFYAWERRGRGWLLWGELVELEPPFRPFLVPQFVRSPDRPDDGRKSTILSKFTDRMLGGARRSEDEAEFEPPDEPEPDSWHGHASISELLVAVPPDLEVARESAENLLLALPKAIGPVAFELVGGGESVRVLLACGRSEEPSVSQTLKAYFPDVLVTSEPDALTSAWVAGGSGIAVVADVGLAHEFMVPLRLVRRFDVDPLASIIAALADLREGETGTFQVLFERTRHPWAREALRAVLDDRGSPFFIDAPEISALAKAKMARPLFSAVLRVGVRTRTRDRSLAIARRLIGALSVLADPAANELMPLQNGAGYRAADHEVDLLLRRTRRSGMILSVEELVSLVHLPTSSVRDTRLLRHGRKTRAAAGIVRQAGVSLGQNIHDGKAVDVRLSPDQRSRHMYLIGASGTGKSTLLLNLIRQDLESGGGLAVLDPHGDLIDRVLGLIPEGRLEDVILIDPADAEFPIGFNILSAGSELEQTLLASDLVGTFRRLSMSWGDQMTSVLGNAILAFLENERVGTLVDLRRFLVEPAFRKEILATVRDPEVAYFWEREFTLLRGKPQAPILTRLDTFLRPKPIRYMVAQSNSRLDLRRAMDEGKIILCRLSHGAIGEENAYLLGTLLVSKLHQVAMSRQDLAEEQRRPFYLYIDEFHHFVTESMASILSGARKYRLGLVLAHQDLRQLQSRSADVMASVIANPCTRVCFRVGDEDARLLAKGFSGFNADDLQNLDVGEAICRVERAEFDFNLRTPPLPTIDPAIARSRKDRVIAQTRDRYGTPRSEIEALLWPKATETDQSNEHALAGGGVETPKRPSISRQSERAGPASPTQPTPPSVEVPTEPSRAGRGGPQHKYIQELIRRWGEAHEWGVTVEERVFDGLGNVDLALRKNGTSVACEIVVSSPAEKEVANLQKCLAAGFSFVAEVSTEKRRLGPIKALAKKQLPEDEFARLAFVSPEELFELLPTLETPLPEKETTVRGYRVRVRLQPGKKTEAEERQGAVSAVIAKALRRIKASKR
jgi:hypothetical protein